MKVYSFNYRHNGKNWSLNYFADNKEDAKRKLQSIKSNAPTDIDELLEGPKYA